MEDFVANIEIQVLEGELFVTLKTDKWKGWALSDDGYIVVGDEPLDADGLSPEENLTYFVDIAVERLLSDKSPFEEEEQTE